MSEPREILFNVPRRCAYCRHWRMIYEPDDSTVLRANDELHGFCELATTDEDDGPAHEDAEAMAIPNMADPYLSGWGAGLRTHLKFGCTSWQARDDRKSNLESERRAS